MPGQPFPDKPADHDPSRGQPEGPCAVGAPGRGARELVLVKNGQRMVFRCHAGGEGQLLGRLAEMAGDPNSGINWFDAAVLCHQMGEQFGLQLRQMRQAS